MGYGFHSYVTNIQKVISSCILHIQYIYICPVKSPLWLLYHIFNRQSSYHRTKLCFVTSISAVCNKLPGGILYWVYILLISVASIPINHYKFSGNHRSTTIVHYILPLCHLMKYWLKMASLAVIIPSYIPIPFDSTNPKPPMIHG